MITKTCGIIRDLYLWYRSILGHEVKIGGKNDIENSKSVGRRDY